MAKDKIYAIIDIETTGGKAARDKITEIAIVLHNGKEIVDRYETLINPERSIPTNITRITNITNDMVADAPKFYEVAKEIVERTKGAIFVAHNVRFDYSFIREEFKRLGFIYSRRQLCTVRLARKVFPGLRSYGLSNLIRHFNITLKGGRHRAMGDTLATVELFELIMNKKSSQTEIDIMVNHGVKVSQLPANIKLTDLHSLPEDCGVYYFYNRIGEIIYIGKSVNIKKRVMSHFVKQTEKSRKLYENVWEIKSIVTGSELAALLLESHEIKYHHPYINRAQRARSFPYVLHSYENQDGYICMDILKVNKKQKQKLNILREYASSYSAKGSLDRILEEFDLCQTYCNIDTIKRPCFYHQIDKCKGACVHKEDPATYNARVMEAIGHLDTDFPDDFILIDKGRTQQEKTVVLIESGIYKGFGYLEEENSYQNIESIKEIIDAYDHNPEVFRIIKHFIHTNRKEIKIIHI